MLFSFAVLLILGGLGIMGFGLHIFYAWLPIFYALLGFEIGFLLGKWIAGGVATAAIVLGIGAAAIAAATAYMLEPYRRLLIGCWLGAVASLSFASLLGLDKFADGVFAVLLTLAGGIAGALLISRIFDLFIVTASAFGGATLVVSGLQALLQVAAWSPIGTSIAALLTMLLTIFGLGWQMGNVASWDPAPSALRDPLPSGAKVAEHRADSKASPRE